MLPTGAPPGRLRRPGRRCLHPPGRTPPGNDGKAVLAARRRGHVPGSRISPPGFRDTRLPVQRVSGNRDHNSMPLACQLVKQAAISNTWLWMADTICTSQPDTFARLLRSGLTNQKRRSMIEAMTEVELWRSVEWHDCSRRLRGHPLSQVPRGYCRDHHQPSPGAQRLPRPHTVKERCKPWPDARYDDKVGSIIPHRLRREKAFCAGGGRRSAATRWLQGTMKAPITSTCSTPA